MTRKDVELFRMMEAMLALEAARAMLVDNPDERPIREMLNEAHAIIDIARKKREALP